MASAALPLSIAIITKNEADNLPRLLDSLKPLHAAEIVIIDSGSTDETVAIAKSYGARVVETDWPGYGPQKNRALEACEQPWILSLDADEPVSNELTDNLRKLFEQGDPSKDGYQISRQTWYLGDWLRHTWYPEWRLRLVRKGKAKWTESRVHESLELNGECGRLNGNIHHYSYNSIKDHFIKSIDYARISAEELARQGKRFRWHKIVLAPLVRFFRLLFIQQGWRDGWRGWIIAWSSMFSGFLKYAFLYEIERKKRISTDD